MMDVFAKNLTTARKAKGLSQQKLADLIGTGIRQITRWEKQETKPSIEAVYQLAVVLDCSIDALVGLQDSATVHEPTNPKLAKLISLASKLNDNKLEALLVVVG